jgi:hypothetical protein
LGKWVPEEACELAFKSHKRDNVSLDLRGSQTVMWNSFQLSKVADAGADDPEAAMSTTSSSPLVCPHDVGSGGCTYVISLLRSF